MSIFFGIYYRCICSWSRSESPHFNRFLYYAYSIISIRINHSLKNFHEWLCSFVNDSINFPSSSDFLLFISPFILVTYVWKALSSSNLSSSPRHFYESSWFSVKISSELIDISSTLSDSLLISSEYSLTCLFFYFNFSVLIKIYFS